MAKRGRPIKEDAKRDNIHFRIGKDESNMLTELIEHTNANRTDLFIDLLRKEYDRVFNKGD